MTEGVPNKNLQAGENPGKQEQAGSNERSPLVSCKHLSQVPEEVANKSQASPVKKKSYAQFLYNTYNNAGL